MNSKPLLVGALTIAASAAVSAAEWPFPGQPPTSQQTPYYPFTQAGYGSGVVYGWFFGADVNVDGYLTGSELTDFQFSFFANDGSSFQSLAVPIGEMLGAGGFSYKLGGSFLGDDTGEFVVAVSSSSDFALSASASGGTFSAPKEFAVTTATTHDLVQVLPLQAIPEPAVSALMLGGLGLGWALRRRNRHS